MTKNKNSFTPSEDFCDVPQFFFGGAKEFLFSLLFIMLPHNFNQKMKQIKPQKWDQK
jgi:hypothetical protein